MEVESSGTLPVSERWVVVGGAGAIGLQVVAQLLQSTSCVSITVFEASSKIPTNEILANPKVNVVHLPIGHVSIQTLSAAMQNIDCVITCVMSDLWTSSAQDFFVTNDQGIKDLLQACVIAGVRRFVHTSSIAVTSHLHPSDEATEDDELPEPSTYISPYDISKRLGEAAVVAANSGKLLTCSLRPGGVLVYHRSKLLSFFPGIIPHACLPYYPVSEQMDFIHVHDFSRALVLAATALAERPSEIGGQVFFITKGFTLYQTELIHGLTRRLGWWNIQVPTPLQSLLIGICKIVTAAMPALGLHPPGVPLHNSISYSLIRQTFNNNKARRILRFKPLIDQEQAFDLICNAWLNDRGKLTATLYPAIPVLLFASPFLLAMVMRRGPSI